MRPNLSNSHVRTPTLGGVGGAESRAVNDPIRHDTPDQRARPPAELRIDRDRGSRLTRLAQGGETELFEYAFESSEGPCFWQDSKVHDRWRPFSLLPIAETPHATSAARRPRGVSSGAKEQPAVGRMA